MNYCDDNLDKSKLLQLLFVVVDLWWWISRVRMVLVILTGTTCRIDVLQKTVSWHWELIWFYGCVFWYTVTKLLKMMNVTLKTNSILFLTFELGIHEIENENIDMKNVNVKTLQNLNFWIIFDLIICTNLNLNFKFKFEQIWICHLKSNLIFSIFDLVI